jgi:transposase
MDMEQETKITLAWNLHQQGTSNSQIAKHLEVNRETVNRWIAVDSGYRRTRLVAVFRNTVQRTKKTASHPASAGSHQAEDLVLA